MKDRYGEKNMAPRHLLPALLLAIPLMGMKCTATAGVDCPGGHCNPHAEIKIERGSALGASLITTLFSLDETFDAALFAIDASQSTVTLPSQGNATLYLKDSTTGTLQASKLFSWYRSGQTIKLSDPDAVNDWILQSAGPADMLTYQMQPFAVGQNAGWNTMATTIVYDSDVLATASSTWRGQVCPNDPLMKRGSKNNIRYCP